MTDIIGNGGCLSDAAERIAEDEDVDDMTAIRQLLCIISTQLECIMGSNWEIEEALGMRTVEGKKKLDG